ncbi:acyltransferase family protein [Desulfovibrio sp. JC010]|uniref:acyltransferase family protein n=1 Tax=Desulfovibrio sp. JC010 TaxID=2593641 RepID=UPI0013D76978|nr:acyltransferase family protein [Desulfovibrio sp. JC010]NDV27543.1 acyltransferase family protein [Desulfovibrio sp. JC010]
MGGGNRLYFIDNLRAFIIGLVVMFHAALCYMAYAPNWWYVLDPQRSFVFTVMVLLTDVFIMPVMFFCAGYFAYTSLRSKGAAHFWKDKQIRITVPWVAGVLLLGPPIAYMTYFTRNVPVSLGQFWMNDFWGKMYQQVQYWFLGILLLFFLLALLAAKIKPELVQKENQAVKPSLLLFIGFLVFTSAAFLFMSLFFSPDYWFNKTYVLSFQPVKIIGLFSYFALGIYAEKQGWFTPQGYSPRAISWTVLALVSAYCFINYRLAIPLETQTTPLLKGGYACLFNLFCLSTTMSLIAIFQKLLNRETRVWKNFAGCSYAIYYVHMYFVFWTAYFLIPYQFSVFSKFTISFVVGLVLSWITANIMKNMPVLRRIF